MIDIPEEMLQPMTYRRVELEGVIPRPAACDERGCRHFYMDTAKESSLWTVWHANGRTYARIPVPRALAEDTPMWLTYLPRIIEQAHEAIDYQEEQRRA